jgi:hypothetical protein
MPQGCVHVEAACACASQRTHSANVDVTPALRGLQELTPIDIDDEPHAAIGCVTRPLLDCAMTMRAATMRVG